MNIIAGIVLLLIHNEHGWFEIG